MVSFEILGEETLDLLTDQISAFSPLNLTKIQEIFYANGKFGADPSFASSAEKEDVVF